jgi:DNA gyrase subunit A
MEVGLVKQIDINEEMQQSYLDYAMSVIISRALPDARDGFKPVHRRILHAMNAMGLRPDSPHRKSARIVGEVLGKFHPHGDMAVYEAMARMAQSFSMRYPLIEGQGNFGSIDGDPPAAMRYTEARLMPLASEIMADLGKDTVAFVDNFDGSLREPSVLPAMAPNMLVNGATGIAVGMSTSIPPHNMGEVCDALIYMLENWSKLDTIGIEDLINFIPGPDFPTGGIIVRGAGDADPLTSAYGSGRGKLTLQARVHVEDMGRGRSRIIVTELPYQVNKSNLIERIADLARGGGLEGLADLRDESDRDGMRIVLELTKTGVPEKILAELHRRTPMQTTFSVIMLALVDGEPRMLSLKQALRVFLDHRLEIVKRRSEYDLARAKEREHLLVGLRIALKNLDDVIQMIRTSRDPDQASQRLQQRLKLSDVQAQAILNMPLRRLSNLERKNIEKEYKEILVQIKTLESLLRSPKKMRNLITQELIEIKNTFGDRRRTMIAQPTKGRRTAVLAAADITPDKDTWVVITSSGMIYRTPTARLPRLSGRRAPELVIGANTHDLLYLFDAQGQASSLLVHTLHESDGLSGAKQLSGATAFDPETALIGGIAIPASKIGQTDGSGFLFLSTRNGMVKKTSLSVLPGASAEIFEAIRIGSGDELGCVALTSGNDDVLLVSNARMAIRFSEKEVRPMGLSAAGVLGIRLGGTGVQVVGMGVIQPDKELFLISEGGRAKRSSLKQFPRQGRHGKGVLAWKSGESTKIIGAVIGESKDRAVVHFSRGAPRSLRFGDAPRRARASSGKVIFELEGKIKVRRISPSLPRSTIAPQPVKKAKKSKPKKEAKGKAQKKTATSTKRRKRVPKSSKKS